MAALSTSAFDIGPNTWAAFSHYPILLEELASREAQIVSMLKLLSDRKAKNTVFRPLLRPLGETRQEQVRRHAEAYKELTNPPDFVSVTYIPGMDCYYGDFHPEENRQKIRKYISIVSEYQDYYPPTDVGVIVSLPLTGQLVGTSLVFAELIVMLKVEDTAWRQCISKTIVPVLDVLSRAGSSLLLDRHERALVGHDPASDVASYFIHPALTRRSHRELLSFKEVAAHGGLRDFRLGYCGNQTRDGWPFLSAFQRTTTSFRSCNVESVPGIVGDVAQLIREADECAPQLASKRDIERRVFRRSLHRWLKVLYAEGGDGRPGSKYKLRHENVVWLAAAVSEAVDAEWLKKPPAEPSTWPCGLALTKQMVHAVGVNPDPNEECGGAEDENDLTPTVAFSWPVVPNLLLMTIAPPLIWLGEPVITACPIHWALPNRLAKILGNPASCWLAAASALVVWHVPAMLQLGMQSSTWHFIQHASFLATGLLFWWPVIEAWPSAARWPRWSILLYLFLTMLPCDVLSGLLVFSDRVVYPMYLSMPQMGGLTPLEFQQCAAALMWACVTVVFLVAGTILSMQMLAPKPRIREAAST